MEIWSIEPSQSLPTCENRRKRENKLKQKQSMNTIYREERRTEQKTRKISREKMGFTSKLER